MSSLTPMIFEGSNVRIHVDEHGEPWFVAKDVCKILGISDYRHALDKLEEDEMCGVLVHASKKTMTAVSESGLYRLIFRSNKPSAGDFRRWVFREVLPTIRKTGSYSANQQEWLAARNQGKLVRKITTDIIAAFIQYAESQGSKSAKMYYTNFSKMVNDSLIEIDGPKPKSIRDELNVVQLHSVSVAENIISKSIVELISKQLPYKEIYQISKQRIASYASTVGRTRIGQSERQTIGLLA